MVVLASTGCGDGDGAAATLPSSTTKVKECSWCPAPDPPGETVADEQAVASTPDLMDHLASTMAGTVFADLTEEEVRADISDICGAGEGGASSLGAATEVAGLRASQLGVTGSGPGTASYARLLESEASRRCT